MKKILCPSMMCADFSELNREISSLENAGIDIYHCDIMDGVYVPNIALGLSDVRALRKLTDKQIDVHLMIDNPSEKVRWFIEAGADIIYLHPDSGKNISKTLQYIREEGKSAGIAIGPDDSLESIYELLYNSDYVLFMTVNPGFAGQKYMDFTRDKLERLIELRKKFGFKIIVDGACSPEVIETLNGIGVDGYILGTSALFRADKTYVDAMKMLREFE